MAKSELAPWKDILWDKLILLNPDDVSRRGDVLFDKKGFYTIKVMDQLCSVILNERLIKSHMAEKYYSKAFSHSEFELLLLSYLINANDIQIANNWISEKNLAGGNVFFTGVHQLPVTELIKKYGRNALAFSEKSMILKGIKTGYGDISYCFTILPKIPLICILWIEDDEFPARASYLFDESIKYHLPLDVILALTRTFIRILTCD